MLIVLGNGTNMININSLTPEYFELAAEWLSRPETNRWLTSEWRGRIIDNRIIAIVVRNKKNRLFVVNNNALPSGIVGLSNINKLDKTAMVWYILGDHSLLRKGVTSKGVSCLVDFAFNEMKLFSLYAWVMNGNIASEKVLNKIGFKKAGCIRLAANSSGKQVDRMYYDLTYQDKYLQL